MREISLLKVLINVFYYAILLSAIGVILFAVVQLLFFNGIGFMADSDTYIVLNQEIEKATSWKDYTVIFGGFILIGVFVASIYYLRGATIKLIEGDIYDAVVSYRLRLAGKLIIIYIMLNVVFHFIKDLFFHNQISIGLDFDGYSSNMFLIILGFFLMLVSSVLDRARILKLENDLTI